MARPVSDRTVRQRRYALLLLAALAAIAVGVATRKQSDWITFAAGLVLMVLLVRASQLRRCSGHYVKHGPALDDEPSSGEGGDPQARPDGRLVLRARHTAGASLVAPREGVLLADSGLAPKSANLPLLICWPPTRNSGMRSH